MSEINLTGVINKMVNADIINAIISKYERTFSAKIPRYKIVEENSQYVYQQLGECIGREIITSGKAGIRQAVREEYDVIVASTDVYVLSHEEMLELVDEIKKLCGV